MNKALIIAGLIAVGIPSVFADDYDDDIYYNPKKEKAAGSQQSAYIPDMADMDVDEYNRRGQYYVSPVDTIGFTAENGEDFVYTRQIQKFYNPTIVVDNADILADILENSYGNVEVVINNGLPTFAPVYSTLWPYYTSAWYPYYGGWSVGWNWGGWGINFGWSNPWWGPSWGWGPSWAWGPSWGPSWGWGWGPSWDWGWGPSWGWGPGPGYAHNHYRPGGNRPVRPGSGWASDTRPGGNYGGFNTRPGRPGAPSMGGNGSGNGNYHRTSPGSYGTNRPVTGTAGSYGTGSNGNNRGGYTVNSNGHRVRGGSTTGTGTVNSTQRRGSSNSGNTVNSNQPRRNSSTTTNTNRNSNNNNYHRSSGNSRGSSGSFSSP